jgi:hypothetical protein
MMPACNDMFSTTEDGECEKGAAYKHREIFTGLQELVSVVQDPSTHCACYKSGTRAELRIRVIRVFAQLNDVGSALYFTQETMITRIWILTPDQIANLKHNTFEYMSLAARSTTNKSYIYTKNAYQMLYI